MAALRVFDTRQEASSALAESAVASLAAAIAARGEASVAVSGGSTPGPAMLAMSKAKIDWRKVFVGLVDERFVSADHDASNEALARRTLLQNEAASAQFLPMWQPGADPEEAASAASAAYSAALPFDFVLLGMGPDGHTASWFPGSADLGQALASDAAPVVAVDATGCPVAGEHTTRLTLSLPALASSRHAALLVFGEEKKAILDTSMSLPAEERPIRAAADALGDRLTIYWAP